MKTRMQILIKIYAVASLVMAVFSIVNDFDSLLEIPNNLFPFGFVPLIIMGILAISYKMWRYVFFLVVAFGVHLFFLAKPNFEDITSTHDSERVVSIFHANVLDFYSSKAKLKKELEKSSFDLISILECGPEMFDFLNDYKGVSHRILAEVRSDNFGICLLYNKGSFEVKRFSGGVPSIIGRIDSLHVVLTHPVPPISSVYFNDRNNQFQKISNHFKGSKSLVVVGDLNTTPWNHHFNQFIEKLNLVVVGSKFQGTWPASFPIKIQIDYCLKSPGLRLVNFEILPTIHSDHLPLTCSIGY